MGKLTWHGWSTSWDQIHNPNSLVTKENLKHNSSDISTKLTHAKETQTGESLHKKHPPKK